MGSLSHEKEKTQRELAKQNAAIRIAWVEQIFGFLRVATRWGGIVGVAGFVYLGTKELAGETTTATFALIAEVAFSKWVAYTASALFGTGWYLERRARKKNILSTGSYIRELEQKHDPSRSTSGLSLDGDPPGPRRKRQGRP